MLRSKRLLEKLLEGRGDLLQDGLLVVAINTAERVVRSNSELSLKCLDDGTESLLNDLREKLLNTIRDKARNQVDDRLKKSDLSGQRDNITVRRVEKCSEGIDVVAKGVNMAVDSVDVVTNSVEVFNLTIHMLNLTIHMLDASIHLLGLSVKSEVDHTEDILQNSLDVDTMDTVITFVTHLLDDTSNAVEKLSHVLTGNSSIVVSASVLDCVSDGMLDDVVELSLSIDTAHHVVEMSFDAILLRLVGCELIAGTDVSSDAKEKVNDSRLLVPLLGMVSLTNAVEGDETSVVVNGRTNVVGKGCSRREKTISASVGEIGLHLLDVAVGVLDVDAIVIQCDDITNVAV